MLLNDRQIRELAHRGMIEPFAEEFQRGNQISYGLTSFGYDLRAAPEWKIFTNAWSAVADPKQFEARSFIDVQGDSVIIPPNSFALTRSLEYIKMPEDVLAVAVGKSTYARIGIIANVTPLEPGWEGHVTLEFSNTTPLPARMYAHEGVVQLLFFQGDRPDVTYADRKGKYQGQRGITLPRL